MKKIKIGLIGNPNCGKTTIFNYLTGSNQTVGNYTGVTVEKIEGVKYYKNCELNFIDLPGIYSLTTNSIEEIITRDFLIKENPDIILNIIDASNLERNLYLTTQLIEMEVPLVIVLNMIDICCKIGININIEKLSKLLSVPIITTVGTEEKGIDNILETIINYDKKNFITKRVLIKYGEDIEQELAKIIPYLEKNDSLSKKYPLRWIAIKLLENDSEIWNIIKNECENSNEIYKIVIQSIENLKNEYKENTEILIPEMRYGFISGIGTEIIHSTIEARHSISDKIDKIVTNQILGFPIFIFLMWLLFQATFTLSEPFTYLVEKFFDLLSFSLNTLLPEGYIKSLLIEGIIGGVGGVLIFLPNIVILFFAIALLEGTGYMPRAAFIMDKIMVKFGLNGKSFIPMLLGFGCSVPAIMATRTIENEKDRLLTMLAIPFMSCSARFPVYVLFAGTFFTHTQRGNVILSLYLIGIVIALLSSKILKNTILNSDDSTFIMELPIYRMPTLKSLYLHTWNRSVCYLKKAGTVILGFSIFIWILTNLPLNNDIKTMYKNKIDKAKSQKEKNVLESELNSILIQESFAGKIGKVITPILIPIGLGDWKISISLITGLGAKELVISTLGTLYKGIDKDNVNLSLNEAIKKDPNMSKFKAYILMLFVLLYIPCLSTLAIFYKESTSLKWSAFLLFYTTAIAWFICFLVYNIGRIFL